MRYRLLPLALLGLLGLTCAPQGDPKKVDLDPPKIEAPLLTDGLVLEKRINAAIENVERRDLLTTHAFWTIFHGILGMGPDIPLFDPETGKRVKAIDQIATGDKIRGMEFIETPHGLDVVTMAGSGVGQGHQDQFVAEMTQWNMPLTQPILINGKKHLFEEFARHSKMRTSVTRNQELGWAIVIISRHYGTSHRWTNMFAEELSLEDAVRYELKLPIPTAACGGTHRLFGLTWPTTSTCKPAARPKQSGARSPTNSRSRSTTPRSFRTRMDRFPANMSAAPASPTTSTGGSIRRATFWNG